MSQSHRQRQEPAFVSVFFFCWGGDGGGGGGGAAQECKLWPDPIQEVCDSQSRSAQAMSLHRL